MAAARKRAVKKPAAKSRRPRTITARQRERFLEMVAAGWQISKAAEAAGSDRRRFWELTKTDDDFAAAYEAAIEAGTDRLEDEALRRSVEGVEEPVFHKGVLVGHVRKYSDTLLIFLLNGRRPEKFTYRSRSTVEHSGSVEVVQVDAIDEEIRRLMGELAGRGEAPDAREAPPGRVDLPAPGV